MSDGNTNEMESRVAEISPITVQRIQPVEFNKALDKVNNVVKIEMFDWKEVDENTPILNQFANPCLIIYFFSHGTKTVISGHFVNFNISELQQWIQHEDPNYNEYSKNDGSLLIPTKRDVEHLVNRGGQETLDEIRRYEMMMQRVREIIKEQGEQSIDVFLFGQNIGTSDFYNPQQTTEGTAKSITSAITRRFHIDTDIKSAGVSLSNIYDYRTAKLNLNDRSDDTLYLPLSKTILYSRGE